MANNHHHNGNGSGNGSNVPLCRCRVLYIGSAVPTITKDGLQGIQQPLKERYPTTENIETQGIDSWLSVWSNGLLLEYVDGAKQTENAFFPIVTLHYCAAVRYVNVGGFSIEGGGERFIPLDTPFAHVPNSHHPPMFAAIFRRTSGIKVLECHAFICTNERAANALVRCCFHSYADTIYLKMDEKLSGNLGLKAIKELDRSVTPNSELNLSEQENSTTMAIDEMREESNWNERAIGQKTWQRRQQNGEYDSSSIASSLFKKSSKKAAKYRGESRNELFENVRKTGSNNDVRGDYYEVNLSRADSSNYSVYERGPLGFMPPPPPGAIYPPPHPSQMFNGTAFFPPHMMPNGRPQQGPMPLHLPLPFFNGGEGRKLPPPIHLLPPHLKQQFGLMGLPFPPPPGAKMGSAPYPPYMLPPRCVFMMPSPFNVSPQAHYFMMERAAAAAAAKAAADVPAGSGPIITESIYDTFPRQRATYEEPIYLPSSHGMGEAGLDHRSMPPHSSYKPTAISPEHYETYYDTYQRRKIVPERKNLSGSDSDASGEGSQSNNKQYWEAYEASIYRKAHINEKAFANTVAGAALNNNVENGDNFNKKNREKKLRPETPPADYELETSVTPNGKNSQQNATSAVVY